AALAIAALAMVGACCMRRRWWPSLGRMLLRVRMLRRRRAPLRRLRQNLLRDLARLRSGTPAMTLALASTVAAQWIARYGALWFAFAALGHPLPFGLVFLAQSVALHAA